MISRLRYDPPDRATTQAVTLHSTRGRWDSPGRPPWPPPRPGTPGACPGTGWRLSGKMSPHREHSDLLLFSHLNTVGKALVSTVPIILPSVVDPDPHGSGTFAGSSKKLKSI